MHALRTAILEIATTWNGLAIGAGERTTVRVSEATGGGLLLEIEAPFHGDPPPPALPGPTDRLYDHEVVEVFLRGNELALYTEVELSPHGHHFVLRFDGVRNVIVRAAQIPYAARVEGRRWRGLAYLPAALVPAGALHANAFALHGPAGERRHLAAVPVPGERPDFHRPELSRRLFPEL
jgi:hypothetical protein